MLAFARGQRLAARAPKKMTPQIEIRAPFRVADLPLLYSWLKTYWHQVAADDTPSEIGEFVEYYTERSIQAFTFGVYRDGELGGYLEASTGFSDKAAVCHGFFKKAFWGRKTTAYAINLGLSWLFLHGVELVLFTPFSHNRAIILLEKSLGAVEVDELTGRFTQDGKPINTTILALGCERWAKSNPEFVAEQRAIMEPVLKARELTAQF